MEKWGNGGTSYIADVTFISMKKNKVREFIKLSLVKLEINLRMRAAN
jgi:hypothetical protein